MTLFRMSRVVVQRVTRLPQILEKSCTCGMTDARHIFLSSKLYEKRKNEKKIKDQLIIPFMLPVTETGPAKTDKVTIVGAGAVGMGTALSMLMQKICSNICVFDINEELAEGECMDMQHGSVFLNDPKITWASDYDDTACSRLCIVTAGARQKEGETRMQLLQRNVDIIKSIIPKLAENSPASILMIVTNPIDIMSYVAWKLSGFPKNRVIGTGTHLDTARFRFFLAQRLGVAPSSVDGLIIGEHGDSSVPVWSKVSVGGTRLREMNRLLGIPVRDTEKWDKVHVDVVKAAYEVIKRKGYTSWAIGLTAASLADMILNNRNHVAPISVAVRGEQCIEEDVYLSLPCVLGGNGPSGIIKLYMTDEEQELLQKSAKIIAKVQSEVKIY